MVRLRFSVIAVILSERKHIILYFLTLLDVFVVEDAGPVPYQGILCMLAVYEVVSREQFVVGEMHSPDDDVTRIDLELFS